MLIKQSTLELIREGTVTQAFRVWRRPTVKSGGTLHTSIGVLAVDAVERIEVHSLTDGDAQAAGFEDLAALQSALADRSGDPYRITLRYVGEDPRVALRSSTPAGAELDEVLITLRTIDSRSRSGAWTRDFITLIADSPAVRAGDLAPQVGMPLAPFKARVRKLKALGLTESLEVGYRLSARGIAVCEALAAE